MAEAGAGSCLRSSQLPLLGEEGLIVFPILEMRAVRFEVEDRSHCRRESGLNGASVPGPWSSDSYGESTRENLNSLGVRSEQS